MRIKTEDGQTLGAWLARGKRNRPAILLLHGMRGSRADHAPLMRRLHRDGSTVLAVTLRGHGDSTGDTIDFGYSSRHDVIAAVDRLAREKADGRIFICGTSLGGAAALFAGEKLDHRVCGYILESPYKDLKSATWHRVNRRLPPLLDLAAYAGLRMWGQLLLPVSPSTISPDQAISRIPASVPIVILSGSNDAHAPTRDAQAMCERIRDHARVVEFKGGWHANLFAFDPDRYYATVRSLLRN